MGRSTTRRFARPGTAESNAEKLVVVDESGCTLALKFLYIWTPRVLLTGTCCDFEVTQKLLFISVIFPAAGQLLHRGRPHARVLGGFGKRFQV
jgi:hypothetical protein